MPTRPFPMLAIRNKIEELSVDSKRLNRLSDECVRTDPSESREYKELSVQCTKQVAELRKILQVYGTHKEDGRQQYEQFLKDNPTL